MDELDVNAGFDDPYWLEIIKYRLGPYIPHVRKWWAEVADLAPLETGIYAVDYEDNEAAGLLFRFTRTAVRSPIKGVQAFPFIEAGRLQLTGVKGGSTKLIQRILHGRTATLDEFTLVEIHNLPSTFNQGQLIAFVPTDILEDTRLLGKWIYFTNEEIASLIQWKVTEDIYNKAVLKG